jgi:hypothetical protein
MYDSFMLGESTFKMLHLHDCAAEMALYLTSKYQIKLKSYVYNYNFSQSRRSIINSGWDK